MCKHIIDDIKIGKCEGCSQIVYDINNITNEIKLKMRDNGITSVPSTVIDGKIKVVAIPDCPWICDEELYKKLKSEYSLGGDID